MNSALSYVNVRKHSVPVAKAVGSNPYVGPRPFEPGDTAGFFGRTREANEIVAMVLGHQVSVVYAQSGAGKTSLFNAMVLPTLRDEEGCATPPLLRVGGVLPPKIAITDVRNVYVYKSLLNLAPNSDPLLLTDVSLADYLVTMPRPLQVEGQPAPLVLVFDQFEELFTVGSSGGWADKEGFFRQVAEAVRADPYLRVVFVLREDYLAELDPIASRMPERLRVRFRIERLKRAQAMEAVAGPARPTDHPFAPGAAALLVDALLSTKAVTGPGETVEVAGRYVEPLQLQVVCYSIWSQLSSVIGEITEAEVQAFGDVGKALADYYDDAVAAVTADGRVQEGRLRRWFESELITPAHTRGPVIQEPEVTGGIPNDVVHELEALHVIRAERRAGARWYELTHDSFIAPILASNEHRRRTSGLSSLVVAAQRWDERRDLPGAEDTLLRGTELDDAENWASRNPADVGPVEERFLHASRKARRARQKRSRRRAAALGVMLVTLIIVLALSAWAIRQRNDATAARAEAENALLAAQSLLASASQALIRLGPALEAEPTSITLDAKGFDVNRVSFGLPDGTRTGALRQTTPSKWGSGPWVEDSAIFGRDAFTYVEVGRDEWSVYLFDDSRDLSVQMDLFLKKVTFSDAETTGLPPAVVLAATAVPNGWVTTSVVYCCGEGETRGSFEQTSPTEWLEKNPLGEEFRYVERGRDDWTINLGAEDRGIEIALDLHTKEVLEGQYGLGELSVRYKIEVAMT